jgi:hypothetical protein
VFRDTKTWRAVTEAFADGDFANAAALARPLLSRFWFTIRVSDFLVDVFDRGGLPEMADELDAPHVDDRDLHGVSLSTLRTARREWKRGNKPRAKELAKRVVEAWRTVDVTVPAVAEMQAIVDAP